MQMLCLPFPPSMHASPLRIVHGAVDGQGRELSIANHNHVGASGLETGPAWIGIELKYRALFPPLMQDCSQSVRPSVPLPHPHTQQTFTRLIKQTGRGSSSADTDGRRSPDGTQRGRERAEGLANTAQRTHSTKSTTEHWNGIFIVPPFSRTSPGQSEGRVGGDKKLLMMWWGRGVLF